MAAAGTLAQSAPGEDGIVLRASPALQPMPRGDAARRLPLIVRADSLSGRPDLETVAEGNAEFRQAGIVLRADRLTYDYADDLAVARGNVRASKDGNTYSGPEMQLKLQSFEGFFLSPTYFFSRTGAGGTAKRIDFLDEQRAVATGATYTSCPADGSGDPAWLLSTDSVKLDFATNEGIADNAVLRFYGVPILAAPRLSFPLNDERKSGWLPPSIGIESKSGFELAVPYYWNIAPNRDATITPSISTKRGPGVDTQFRYLEPRYNGSIDLNLVPHDRLAGESRYALNLKHESTLPGDTLLEIKALRVSDDNYWKDFSGSSVSPTPRLLMSNLQASRPLGDWNTYVRVETWQALQTADVASRIEAPYERLPQIGARYDQRWGEGFLVDFEGEFNRFVNPADALTAPRPTGSRVHALGSLSRPFVSPGWTLTPKVSFNAATYELDQPLADGRTSASRIIPTLSLDSAWVLERDANWFGRAVRQTLEPRVIYVNTPYHAQNDLPNFDSAVKDFNFESIFSENTFSGVDRVADSHQLTAGVTTRLLDPETGAEAARFGIAQRYLFRNQRITLTPEGQPDVPFTQSLSDVLLLASTTMVPNWNLDASVQYSPDSSRTVRSIIGARYSPGPFRTVSATYRFARGLSEQVELGWQWPIYGQTPDATKAQAAGASCGGSWYGVGRVNYSTFDRRVIDSVLGFEYDAGCWIGRIVTERLSTGLTEASTRVLFQLELVGLSRLGSNPLQVLKDNIPGYRLLRDDRATSPLTNSYD